MSETITTSKTGGKKGVKPERHSLVPVGPLAIVARHYAYGAEKYGDADNWRLGYEWSKAYDALRRHADAFWGGEDMDRESGLPHLAAVVFHAFSLLEWSSTHPEFDDRHSTKHVTNAAQDALNRIRNDGYIDSEGRLWKLLSTGYWVNPGCNWRYRSLEHLKEAWG